MAAGANEPGIDVIVVPASAKERARPAGDEHRVDDHPVGVERLEPSGRSLVLLLADRIVGEEGIEPRPRAHRAEAHRRAGVVLAEIDAADRPGAIAPAPALDARPGPGEDLGEAGMFDEIADRPAAALGVVVDGGEDPEAPVASLDPDEAGGAMHEKRRLGMPTRGED